MCRKQAGIYRKPFYAGRSARTLSDSQSSKSSYEIRRLHAVQSVLTTSCDRYLSFLCGIGDTIIFVDAGPPPHLGRGPMVSKAGSRMWPITAPKRQCQPTRWP